MTKRKTVRAKRTRVSRPESNGELIDGTITIVVRGGPHDGGNAMTHAELVARAARWLAGSQRCIHVVTEPCNLVLREQPVAKAVSKHASREIAVRPVALQRLVDNRPKLRRNIGSVLVETIEPDLVGCVRSDRGSRGRQRSHLGNWRQGANRNQRRWRRFGTRGIVCARSPALTQPRSLCGPVLSV